MVPIFIFLAVSSEEKKFEILMKPNLFSFKSGVICVPSKRVLPNRSQIFSVFSSRSAILALKSSLWKILSCFLYMVWSKVRILNYLVTFAENKLTAYVWVCFQILYFVPFIYVYSFINIILSWSWKSYSVNSPALLLLSKIALAIPAPSHFHMNFRIASHFTHTQKTA